MTNELDRAVSKVVKRGNCSGCGACALIDRRIGMALNAEGFLRPELPDRSDSISSAHAAKLFDRVCPGVRVVAPDHETGAKFHPVFGQYVSSWAGWATNAEVRFGGSSAGVLTALSAWLIESGRVAKVVGSAGSRQDPTRTVPVTITTRQEALISAGSRYAPVANLVQYDPSDTTQALVGKPCEISAAAQMHNATHGTADERPVMLSFFCAGTPSQHATESLLARLNVEQEDVASLRYRGNGWPGRFRVVNAAGKESSLSYDESWGDHLGRDLQWRCKVCVDGTGGHADIAVGDYWDAGADGFPKFDDAEGVSAVIARTVRGHLLLLEAAAEGVIIMEDLDVDRVALIQPLQVERKTTLVGRLIGRWLASKRPPRYRGFRLGRIGASDLKGNLRAAVGTFRRTLL